MTGKCQILPLLALTALMLCAYAEEPEGLTVFCGAGLTGAFSEIGQKYENMSNLSVDFNFDGVPALRAQIEQGAYADVIVSANLKHMDALRSEGYMDNNTVEIFAGNKVAVIVPDEYNVVGKFPLGVLLQSRHPEEAQSFIDLVMSDEGQAILGKYGFIPVDEVQKS